MSLPARYRGDRNRPLLTIIDARRAGTFTRKRWPSGAASYASNWATPTRLTFDPASDLRPLWSKDESAIVFARERADGWQIYEVRLERPGVERALLPRLSSDALGPVSWDGDVLEYATTRRGRASRLWSLRPGRDEAPRLPRPDEEGGLRDPGVGDVRRECEPPAVRRYAPLALACRSCSQRSAPRWRSDGRELFFIAPGSRVNGPKTYIA